MQIRQKRKRHPPPRLILRYDERRYPVRLLVVDEDLVGGVGEFRVAGSDFGEDGLAGYGGGGVSIAARCSRRSLPCLSNPSVSCHHSHHLLARLRPLASSAFPASPAEPAIVPSSISFPQDLLPARPRLPVLVSTTSTSQFDDDEDEMRETHR
jgi:hypothetical protein